MAHYGICASHVAPLLPPCSNSKTWNKKNLKTLAPSRPFHKIRGFSVMAEFSLCKGMISTYFTRWGETQHYIKPHWLLLRRASVIIKKWISDTFLMRPSGLLFSLAAYIFISMLPWPLMYFWQCDWKKTQSLQIDSETFTNSMSSHIIAQWVLIISQFSVLYFLHIFHSIYSMWNKETFYLFGLRAEATVGLWTENQSAGSDKAAPTPDKRAVGPSQQQLESHVKLCLSYTWDV